MGELEAEFEACLDPLDERGHVSKLRRLGIPDRVIYGPRSLVGVARIMPCTSGFFEFHEYGEKALVIAEGEPAVPGWSLIEDLVAFQPGNPCRWWLRRGAVQLLGEHNLRSWKLGETVLHATPLDWLQSGGEGVCVLDWKLDPSVLLYGTGAGLVADSAALKAKLLDRVQEAAVEPWKIEVAHASA